MLCRLTAALIFGTMLTSLSAAAPPLKALIVDGQNNHNWVETTPYLKKHLEETGLFTVDVATSPAQGEDMSGFKPNFAAYDVVVSNYTGDAWPAATQKALEDYVGGGGGLVVFHAANNAFPEWKEFNRMAGLGGWGGRNEKDGPYVRWRDGKIVRDTTPGPGGGHGPQHEFQIVVREPDHPITRGLPNVFMHSADELYNRLRGPAENMTVLATAFSPKEQRGTGEHEPQLMTIAYGEGRVFHIAYGHAGKQCQSVAFIVPFQRGSEWAATEKVTQAVPQDFPGPDQPSLRP
ncbi:MAG: ThuA domain-containing protein [Rhodopirellula sp.]|nr:ThuA domain-containing protein [Rhodopirellula sp.]